MANAGLPTTLARLTRLLLATMAVGVLAACGPPDEDDGATAQERLDAAAARMEQVRSLHFTLSHEEGHTALIAGMALQEVRGVVTDSAQITAEAELIILGANTFLETEITIDGENASLTDPLSGNPLSLPSNTLPLDLRAIGSTLSGILSSIKDPVFTTAENLDGVPSQGIAGTLTGADLRPLIPASVAPWQQEIEVGVGDDDLVRSVRLSGRILSSDPDQVIRILTFSGFNETQGSGGAP